MAKNKDVTVSLGKVSDRAEIEQRRGIRRDEEGRIIRTDTWRKARLTHLDAKEADLKQRIKNVQEERKTHLAALKK